MKKKELLIIFLTIMVVVAGCKKDEVDIPSRLFRPAVGAALVADSNAILASWLKITDAASYTLQVSRDSFRTIDVTMNVKDTGIVLVKNLQWDKLYQVQVKANAGDTVFNSKWSFLGAIKTPRFPTILNTPALSDITENAVKVSWTTSGAAVTTVKILKATDSSVVSTTALTPADVTSQSRIINGLNTATGYIIFLYSNTTVRGWVNFSTKAPFAGILVDLRGITGRPSVLADTIPLIASGSTVILKRGEVYTITAALNLSKAITIVSGTDLSVPGQAVITMPANFNITSGSVIDSIVFNDVTLRGTDYAAKYVFNISAACTIGKMSFIGCRAEIFRGMIRLQSQPVIVNNLWIDNCVLDSLAGYGVITVDVATSKVDNITIRNSTIYKAEKIIVSKNNSTSVTIENCTINEAALGGGSSYYVDYNTAATNNVTNGIIINNCIFGVGKIGTGGVQTVRGIRVNAASNISASNNFRTSDQVSLGNDVPNITPYARPAAQLFQDPLNGIFKIADASFTGKSNAGDPRWRL
ncbi:MAG: hypothetical protein JWP81_2774 [Ferruginibacter sp.]|nr:hypothetical protein [Ferruginibacter sp.]